MKEENKHYMSYVDSYKAMFNMNGLDLDSIANQFLSDIKVAREELKEEPTNEYQYILIAR